MVGVPRSKGCRICVQRRVKCDQTHPTCKNCKKGNRPCPGYTQDLKFHDEGARLRKRFARSDTPSSSSGSDPEGYHETADSRFVGESATSKGSKLLDAYHVNASSPTLALPGQDSRHWDVLGLDMNKTRRRTFVGLLGGKTKAYGGGASDCLKTTNSNYTLNLGGTAYADRIMFLDFEEAWDPIYKEVHSPENSQNALMQSFHQSLFPDNGTVPVALKSHSRWLAHLPPLTGTNDLLDSSVRAVTLVHIGRLNNSEPLVMESRPYYGQALRLLNKALQDKTKGASSETMCAVILLSFYEMFASDNNDSWVRHAGGVSALMRARGPRAHRHGLDREMFLAYRYTLIIEAFQEDVPCFLAEPGWLDLSAEIHDDLKKAGIGASRIEIFDVAEDFYAAMVGIPELAGQARTLGQAMETGTRPSINRAQLVESMTTARAHFKNTFTRFESALKKAGHSPTVDLNHRDPLISMEYQFINNFVASTYTGYWTVSIVLNLCLQGLQRNDVEMVQLYQTEMRECALNICRSSAYMLTSSFLGPFFLIFGLRVGLLVFEEKVNADTSPEADWILRKLFDIGDRHMGIAKHVPGYRPGITVDELIAEFRTRKAASQQKNDAERVEFTRQVWNGDVFVPSPDANMFPAGFDMDVQGLQGDVGVFDSLEYLSSSGNQRGRQEGIWHGLTRSEDVMKAWEEQDNFQLRTNMDNLTVTPSTSNNGGGSRSSSRSPMAMPQMTSTEQQCVYSSANFAMPDVGSSDPSFGLEDSTGVPHNG